ncbi:hypothetical protein R6Z07F_012790 [Ovis aries]
MLGLKMASTASCPSKPVTPEAEDGCSAAGDPVESQRSENRESLAPCAQIGGGWDLGCSCRPSQPQSPLAHDSCRVSTVGTAWLDLASEWNVVPVHRILHGLSVRVLGPGSQCKPHSPCPYSTVSALVSSILHLETAQLQRSGKLTGRSPPKA